MLKLFFNLSNSKSWLSFAFTAPIVAFVEKFIFNDWTYLQFLMIIVGLDFITGVTKAWKDGQAITSKGWRNSVSKAVQYSAFLICTHILINLEIGGEKVNIPLDWVNEGAYLFLISIEIKSVYENIVGINPNLDFLRPIIKRLDHFIQKPKSE